MAPDATKTRYREARRRRRADHPHYACDLPPEAHPIKRGVGRDHRAGCAVAEGHTPGASAGSRSCDRCHLDTIKKHYRRNTLRRVFGLSLEEYDGLLKSQEGGCAICGRTTEIALAVDHDHATGSVRGLLCRECNLGLGNFMDDPALLDAASSYLRKVVMRP
jgi:hypothetical protein